MNTTSTVFQQASTKPIVAPIVPEIVVPESTKIKIDIESELERLCAWAHIQEKINDKILECFEKDSNFINDLQRRYCNLINWAQWAFFVNGVLWLILLVFVCFKK